MPRILEKTAPKALPPEAAALEPAMGDGAPTLDAAVIAETGAASPGAEPALAPPTEVAEVAARSEQGIAAWHSGVKITALWCNASVRNAWAVVEGVGWRRVNPANDSAFVTLVALLSHARQMGTTCNVRVEADNLIHEVYAW
jgi:hypothetical protein